MSTNDERAKDAEALAVFALIERGTEPVESADVTAAYLHLAARLDSLAGEVERLHAENDALREAGSGDQERADREAHRARKAEAELARLREALEKIAALPLSSMPKRTTTAAIAVRVASEALAAQSQGEG
jgi:transposase